MKNFVRTIAVLMGCLSGGCGGVGETGPTDAAGAPPAAASHAWDSWNWDEGAFGD